MDLSFRRGSSTATVLMAGKSFIYLELRWLLHEKDPKSYWLVVWLPFFIFPYIGLLIIPIDEILFFRGVAQPPTSIGQFKIFQQATFQIPAASAPPQPISAEMEERIATQRCAGGTTLAISPKAEDSLGRSQSLKILKIISQYSYIPLSSYSPPF